MADATSPSHRSDRVEGNMMLLLGEVRRIYRADSSVREARIRANTLFHW